MSYTVEVLSPAKCIVGEGPVWDKDNKRLLMVDIQGRRLREIIWDTLKVSDAVLEQECGYVMLGESGNIIVAAEDGIYSINSDSKLSRINKPFTIKGMRFNDGKVGPDGKMYGGTFSRDKSAAFYKMEADGTLIELFDGVGNSNGLDWDDKHGIMYYNDTPTGYTDAFDFKDGVLTNRRHIIRYEFGNPDGMTIDADGNLWTALWGSGFVVCVDPRKGEIVEKIKLPVSQPACCAFAGDDLKTLVITTAAHGVMLKDEPLAGSVFAVRTSVSGKLPNKLINY